MEVILAASEQAGAAPETQFDAALILEEIPLPNEAARQWRETALSERDREWREEAAQHLAAVERRVARRVPGRVFVR